MEESFGHVDPDSTSTISTNAPGQKPANAEKPTDEEHPEKVAAILIRESSLATTELVFPLRSLSPVIASIPESLLPLHGPEALSHYRCQHPSCDEEFSQKAAACNHAHHDYLNVALACLYCSDNKCPKMRWYSASAWEHHTHQHTQDNLSIHPDDPAFYEQFSEAETLPSTLKLATILPQTINIQERAKAAKQFVEEGDKKSPSPEVCTHSPTTLKLAYQARSHKHLAKKSRQLNIKMMMSRYS